MQPEIFKGSYYEVDTSEGIEILPLDAVGEIRDLASMQELLICREIYSEEEEALEIKQGWLARLTMPGYLDSTEWTAHETEQEALEYLEELVEDTNNGV